MSDPRFVHLRLHSEYSVTDGIVRIDDAVSRAAACGMPALALTDLANLFGLVKFYLAARGAGVKPVLGCDIHLANETDPDRPYRMLLLCRSHQGYLQLCELLTRAYLVPRVRGRAETLDALIAARKSVVPGAHVGVTIDPSEILIFPRDPLASA